MDVFLSWSVEVAVATACVWLIVLEMKRRQKGTL